MNLKQLEAFAAVVENRSFSQAAKVLFLTQPTISANISSLEKELNTKLLIRNTKEVRPSKQGDLLYIYARQMVDLETEIFEKFNIGNRGYKHIITLAASTIPAQYILPQILSKYSEEYPESHFKMIESDSAGVANMISNHVVEIGFAGTAILAPQCKSLPFCKDKLVVITPNQSKYQQMKESGATLEELLKEPILMREEGSGTRKEAEEYIKKSGGKVSDLNIIANINNQETIKKSVSNGMGISIISALAVQDYLSEGRILAFDFAGGIYRDLTIVKNKNFNLSQSADRFVKFAKKYIESGEL